MLRLFQHYVPVSLVWLICIEFFALFASVYAGVEIRFLEGDFSSRQLLEPLLPKAIVFTVIMGGAMTAMGLHTRNIVDDFAGIMIRIALSFFIGFLVSTLVFYIVPSWYLGRGVFGLAILISFFAILITRTIYQKIDKFHIFKRRVLVLGAGTQASILHGLEDKARRRGHDIVGYVSVDADSELVPEDRLLKVTSTLLDLACDHDVDEIVLAMDDRRQGFPLSGLMECKMKGLFVIDLLHFLERVTGHIELDALHPSMIIFSSGFTKAVTPGNAKRIFDILASSLLLVLASPVILLTAAAIWLSSFGRAPVLYGQIRIGLCDAPFRVLKFRSMKTDAEKDGAQFAKKKDSRVTRIGWFIRKTRIDELPQLLNVLKGDMSFIGPRPERPEFVLGFEQNIPHYALRHTVKPGITGWAQISYPYGETEEDTRNKLQYDLYYIKNYSLFLDMTILFQTAQVVLFGQGAR